MIIDLGPWHLELHAWDSVGFAGQVLFASRFVVQWIASERVGRSYVPRVFWWISIIGGLVSLVYAVGIHNTVYTLAQSVGLVPYARNIVLLQRSGERPAPADLPTQSTK